MSLPVKKFVVGGVSAAVFENEGKFSEEGSNSVYYSVSLQRSYKVDNDWKNSNSFRIGDLPKAVLALQKAYEFLALKENG